MRSFLATVMMFVMLTPGLACAKTMCANMDAMATQGEDMPCHGEMADMDSDPAVMIAIDCAKVDLASADPVPTIKAPADTAQLVLAFWAAEQLHGLQIADARFIRGPPDKGFSHSSYPSIFLNTQRIRI